MNNHQTNTKNTFSSIIELLKPLDETNLVIVKSFISTLLENIDERKNAEKELIRDETYKNLVSPKCKSTNVKKNGTKNEKQRYRCNDCHYVFTLNSHTSLRYTKLSFDKRYEFVDMSQYDMSLLSIASRIKVSLPTTFLMRHKLFETLKFFQNSLILSGNIYADELYFPRNCKDGSSLDYRNSRKHGSDKKEIENRRKDQIIVMMAFDDEGHCLLKRIKTGSNKSEQMDKFFRKRVKDNSTLYTDGYRHYKTIAELINAVHIADKGTNDMTEEHQRINDFSSSVKRFINDIHKGVSTKYLQSYLNWYSFLYFINHQTDDIKKTLIKILSHLLSSTITITRRELYSRGRKKRKSNPLV